MLMNKSLHSDKNNNNNSTNLLVYERKLSKNDYLRPTDKNRSY